MAPEGGVERGALNLPGANLRGLVRADVACKTSGDQNKVRRTMKPTLFAKTTVPDHVQEATRNEVICGNYRL